MIPSLTEDCHRCAALCCVALAFDRGNSFVIDKPAGTPCPKLDGPLCGGHATLTEDGFSGCVRYSCAGAGQRVVQELFAGQSWQEDATLLRPMMDAFRGMRAVQERLALLEATKALDLDADDRARVQALVAQLLPDAVTRDSVIDFPGSPLEREIDGFIRSLARYVTP